MNRAARIAEAAHGGQVLVSDATRALVEHTLPRGTSLNISDGRILPWARIIGWHRPDSLLMAWRPHSSPQPPTEVGVTFDARDDGTLFNLEHRGWERRSDDFREGLYDIYARGWITTLERFAAAADRDMG